MRAGTGALFLLLGGVCSGWAAQSVDTNPLNRDPQVREAFEHFYDLDYAGAVSRFARIHAEHAGDPHATVLLLEAEVFQELYRQDLLDTTFYANDGFLSGKHATDEDAQVRDRLFALADQAINEANARLSHDSKDVNALYARGWARALRCAYMAMVERSFRSGMGLASEAKDDEERVLELNPNYVDANLVVGVYNYVVGALPLPFKILIGFMGISGSKTKGMQMLREDGQRGVATSVEARTVTALFLRREGKYRDAIDVVRKLEQEYPRNFLFALEDANLRKDDGQGMAAVEGYREVVANAKRIGYYASARPELAYFGLGEALRGQRHYEEAAKAYEEAALTPGAGTELKVRCLVAAGQSHDLIHERDAAVRDYRMAIDAGPNTSRADAARKYLKSRFAGS